MLAGERATLSRRVGAVAIGGCSGAFPRCLVALGFVGLSACTGSGGGNGGGEGGGSAAAAGEGDSGAAPRPALTSPPAEFAATPRLSLINAEAAYEADALGRDVTVAIVDSGIDRDHREFAGRIHPASIDIVTDSTATLDDESGHGSHIAGIVGAAADGRGVVGVAPESRILAIRADLRDSSVCDEPGCAYADDDVARAIRHGLDSGSDVVNISLGKDGPINRAYRRALERAADEGALVVTAAGNGGADALLTPAGLADADGLDGHLLAVGAVDDDGRPWSKSNSAERQSLARRLLMAPGVNVRSTDKDGGYARLEGTSMAAAHVSGAAAVLKSRFPSLTMGEVAAILLDSARDIGADGVDLATGRGLLDLEAALGPVGETSLPAGDHVEDGGPALSSTRLSLGRAFGDALTSAPALSEGMVVDSYDRPYRLDLGDLVEHPPQRLDLEGLMVEAAHRKRVVLTGPALSATLFFETPEAAGILETPEASGRRRNAPTDDGRVAGLSLDQGLGGAGRVRFGVGLSAAARLAPTALGGDDASGAEASGLFLDGSGLTAPLDGAFGEVSGVGYGLALAEDVGFALGLARLDGKAEDGRPQEGADGGGRMVAATLEKGWGRHRLRLGLRLVEEAASLLGSHGGGGLALPEGSRSVFFDLGGRIALAEGVTLLGRASLGETDPGRSQGLIGEWRTVRSSAMALALIAEDILDEGDRLGLLVAQPLRVEAAAATIDMATSRDLEGQVSRRRERVELVPSGREIDLELAYGRTLGPATAARGWLLFRRHPGHDAAAGPDLGLGMRLTRRF